MRIPAADADEPQWHSTPVSLQNPRGRLVADARGIAGLLVLWEWAALTSASFVPLSHVGDVGIGPIEQGESRHAIPVRTR